MPGFTVKALAGLSLAQLSAAWLPSADKIRGVNIGAKYVVEPWMAGNTWNTIGCADQQSEFDCVNKLGQDGADEAFKAHWDRWIPESDLDEMVSYGLNTIRIPVGYWLKEDLVDSSEHFPRGGFEHFKGFCDAAAQRNLYIIVDLHGGPGAQDAEQPFTGQFAPSSGFYDDYNYGRAVEWHKWMTEQAHTLNELRNVGMIELINEPQFGDSSVESMRSQFYVDAYNAIRDVEKSMNVSSDKALHVQSMNSLWGSGDPKQYLPANPTNLAFDDHRYLKHDGSVAVDHDSYISNSCSVSRQADGEDPTIVGEWSLSPPDDVQDQDYWAANDANVGFYQQWFNAQIQTYQKAKGFVFWSWQTDLGDYRWSYKDAVGAGVINKDLDAATSAQAC